MYQKYFTISTSRRILTISFKKEFAPKLFHKQVYSYSQETEYVLDLFRRIHIFYRVKHKAQPDTYDPSDTNDISNDWTFEETSGYQEQLGQTSPVTLARSRPPNQERMCLKVGKVHGNIKEVLESYVVKSNLPAELIEAARREYAAFEVIYEDLKPIVMAAMRINECAHEGISKNPDSEFPPVCLPCMQALNEVLATHGKKLNDIFMPANSTT